MNRIVLLHVVIIHTFFLLMFYCPSTYELIKIVVDNDKVLASCSNFSPDKSNTNQTGIHNIALTLCSARSKLESFSNFIPSSSSSTTPQNHCTTSISFGGNNAKSRYVCVSDSGGYISVWDMKKQPVKRVRHFHLISNDNLNVACSKACLDPSDTFIIGLHNNAGMALSSPSSLSSQNNYYNQHVMLDLFHLKHGTLVSSLRDDGSHGGSSNCLHCSNLDSSKLLVGARDGSLLLWDLSSSSSTKKSGVNYIPPMTTLEKRHDDCVTDLEFSPMNKVLAASCSLDGTIVFHDVHSQKKIQTLQPTLSTGANLGGTVGNRIGLTSLAFHSNGYTWAVGTNNGYVMNYDLRQISSGPLSTINVGDLGEVMMTTADNRSRIKKRISYPINRLQFSPVQPSSKTPKSIKKKTMVSPVANNVATSIQTKQQSIHVKEHVETLQSSSSKKEMRKDVQQLISPELSSPTVPKELFQMNDANYEDTKNDTAIVKTNKLEKISESSKDNDSSIIEKSPILKQGGQIQQQTQSVTSQKNSTSKTESINGRSPSDTNGIIQSFDQMYERLKNREPIYSSPQSPQTESNDTMNKTNDESSQIFMITKV